MKEHKKIPESLTTQIQKLQSKGSNESPRLNDPTQEQELSPGQWNAVNWGPLVTLRSHQERERWKFKAMPLLNAKRMASTARNKRWQVL